MCSGVKYVAKGEIITQIFANRKAVLPVKTKNGLVYLPWGRRESQAGETPLGGWAEYTSLRAGQWNRFLPKPCKIMVAEFIERDTLTGEEKWFSLKANEFIHGIYCRDAGHYRAYVITLRPTLQTQYSRWPRVLTFAC